VQIANALPYDLEETALPEYKNLDARWHRWTVVKAACARLSTVLFDRIHHMQEPQTQGWNTPTLIATYLLPERA